MFIANALDVMRFIFLKCCSDDLRKYANEEGLNVTTPKAWGAITNSIFRAKDGWIEVGRKQSEIEGNHARKISVFRLVK